MQQNGGKILVVRFSSLGDIVLTFRALERLHAIPGTTIEYLTKSKFKDVVTENKRVSKVHAISDHAKVGELYRAAASAVRENYTVIFDLHRNMRSFLFCFFYKFQKGRARFLRIRKYRVKELILFVFRQKLFNWIFPSNALDRRKEPLRIIDRHFGSFDSSSIMDADVVKTSSSDSLIVVDKSKYKKIISMNCESLWHEKEWGFSKFMQVKDLLKKEGHLVVLTGLNLVENPEESGVLNLTSKTNLKQLLQVYRESDLVVCNDSGAMHLAESVGRPVVAIFGPTSRELGFAPRNSRSVVVEAQLWCRPCSKNGRACFRIANKQLCLSLITAEDVYHKVQNVLMTGQGAS